MVVCWAVVETVVRMEARVCAIVVRVRDKAERAVMISGAIARGPDRVVSLDQVGSAVEVETGLDEGSFGVETSMGDVVADTLDPGVVIMHL